MLNVVIRVPKFVHGCPIPFQTRERALSLTMFAMKVERLRFSHQIQWVPLLLLHACRGVRAQPTSDLRETQYYKLGPDLSRPIAVIVVVLVLIFFVIVFVSVYLRHCVELSAATNAVRRSTGVDGFRMCHGLDPAVIRTFPVVVYSAVKDLKIGKWSLECAVCLSEFQEYETLRLLPKCGHVYHPNCIDAWLASCATCPICRARLTSDYNDKDKRTASSRRITAGGESSSSELGGVGNVDCHHVVTINVDEADRNGDDDSEVAERENSLMMTRRATEIPGKFRRSHSTGHSLVEPEEDTSPEEMKRQITKLKRSASYDTELHILEANLSAP